MTRALFNAGDASDQDENRLSKEVSKLKDDLKNQTEKFDEINKQLAKSFVERKSSKTLLGNLSQEV